MNKLNNQLTEIVNSYVTYKKGERYFAQKHVTPLKGFISDTTTYFATHVSGTDDSYEVNVTLNNDTITHYSCGCLASRTYTGACKHVIAACLYYQENGIAEITTLSNLANILSKTKTNTNKVVESPKAITDSLMFSLIKDYEDDFIYENAPSIKGSVHLVPILFYHQPNKIVLTLKIGIDTFYIVKDIQQMLQAIRKKTKIHYGAKLDFVHDLSCFDKSSQALIELIQAKTREKESITHADYHYNYMQENTLRSFHLFPSAMDAFFDYALQFKIPVHFDPLDSPVYLFDEDPFLDLTIEQLADLQFTLKLNSPYKIIQGQDSLYLLIQDRLCRLSKNYTTQMEPFLNRFSSTSSKIYISAMDMPAVYGGLLAKISDYTHIEYPEHIDKFIPQSCDIQFYLDVNNSQEITAAVEFKYAFLASENNTVFIRDDVKEKKINYHLHQIFDEYNEETKQYTLNTDEHILMFFQTGILQLQEMGEVYTTQNFNQMKAPIPIKLQTSLKISNNLLEMNLDFKGIDPLELKHILKAYKAKKKYYRLKEGQFIDIEGSGIHELEDFMDTMDLSALDLSKKQILLPQYKALQLDALSGNFSTLIPHFDQSYLDLIQSIHSPSTNYPLSNSMNSTMRQYQKEGYQWLQTMAHYHFGGILADDMGLGKTIQVIGYIESLLSQNKQAKILIITPSSLVYNWKDEFDKFSNLISLNLISGNASERQLALSLDYQNVFITSYDLLKRDIDLYTHLVFDCCIIDEAQAIKNANTLASKTVKQIKAQQRFALSGTPIENSLAELWSIFDFLMPGYLSNYHHFKKRYEVPIVKKQNQEQLDKLKKSVAPFILRRLKKDVLKELPDKNEIVLFSTMEEEQKKLYLANALEMMNLLKTKFKEKQGDQNKLLVLTYLMKLRQLCNHPRLVYENYTSPSCKLEQCMELIQNNIDSNHRILLFSQFTSMLDLIIPELQKQHIPFYLLTGSTSKTERIRLVHEFNKNAVPIFLISLKAGGTGLNLIGADVVIHFDPWWNLSAQNQATDRTHRIGQKRKVTVYKLIVKDSIEEKILQLQKQKYELAQSIVEENDVSISKMSKEDLIELFSIDD